MAYTWITPNSSVWLLQDVPLEPDYEHTVLFQVGSNETLSAARLRQKNAFVNNTYLIGTVQNPIGTLTNQMYKRVNKNTIKVNRNYDDIFMCNYMVFQNYSGLVGHVDKYYYAFVLELNYISEGTTEIVYEIDVMQTWMFDYRLMECFVEREHSASDNIGENTLPESFEAGDYVVVATDFFKDTLGASIVNDNYSVVVAAPWKATVNGPQGIPPVEYDYEHENFYDRSFSGLYYNCYNIDLDDIPEQGIGTFGGHGLNDLYYLFLNLSTAAHQTQNSEIVAIYIVPTRFCTTPNLKPNGDFSRIASFVSKYNTWTYKKSASATAAKPRNNKLYTYPFNMLKVTTSDGAEVEYAYEKFYEESEEHPNTCWFVIAGSMGSPPQLQLIPVKYRMSNSYNYSESIILQNFPICSWVTDTFKAWLAQNGTKMLLSGLTNAAEIGIGVATGNAGMIGSAAYSLGGDIANSLTSIASASFMPDDSHGISGAMIGTNNGELGFRYYAIRVKDEYAAIIDDYFDKFGYATKRLKIPNRSVRPHWCYTQTKGCALAGIHQGEVNNGLPSGAAEKIKDVYNNGVTFWKLISEVGDYSLANSPT